MKRAVFLSFGGDDSKAKVDEDLKRFVTLVNDWKISLKDEILIVEKNGDKKILK